MEAALIDWKTIDSRFVRDELFEGISAPKWVDFSAVDDTIDDEAWFCKPSCDHPKTAEDFLKKKKKTGSPNSVFKVSVSSHILNSSPVDRNKRDPTLKKRIKGVKCEFEAEADENQNPNFSSSNLKKTIDDNMMGMGREMRKTKLRSTMSAKNLFSGGDFLNKVAEICTELKRLATRTKDKENANLEGLNEKEKETKPFLKQQQQQRRNKKRQVDGDVENAAPKSIDGETSMQIRTCPPTPQCFSASANNQGKAIVPKPFRARAQNVEMGILQELKWEESVTEEKQTGGSSVDVFCFLKPCTLSS